MPLLVGMRVHQVYDVDSKTYLIRLHRQDEKSVLVLESGNRIHTTTYDWPKHPAPSGFAMKLRKHISNKRLESITQLGMDRILDLQFGSGEVAFHIILELYDRGNIALTDHEYTILNILRPRGEGEDVRFRVSEKYPINQVQPPRGQLTIERLEEIFATAKSGENLKKILNPHLECGPGVLEHCLLSAGFPKNAGVGKGFDPKQDYPRLASALQEAEDFLHKAASQPFKGYIIQKEEVRTVAEGDDGAEKGKFLSFHEFYPMLFKQHEGMPFLEFLTFDQAVDEFFSKLESQKLDLKVVQQEKEAMKKLQNIRLDHEKRLEGLLKTQALDRRKAELIQANLDLVEKALLVVRSAIGNKMSWRRIDELVEEAKAAGDPVASCIHGLKLEINHFTMRLTYPFEHFEGEEEEDDGLPRMMDVDIDLDLSAFANARSAEKKAKQTLKEAATIALVKKSRKTFWFEKFYWFISSENYLGSTQNNILSVCSVIGGRDQQQNEVIVKRYMKANDIYVHADIHGASSVVIKNPSGNPVPPKTLNEAGVMAVCYSMAWEAKVVTSAWWVHATQVSKTAPTGEYLTTGSFMIRGKKSYLLPAHLVMGFGFLFKITETSIELHKDERKIRGHEDDGMSMTSSESEQDIEIPLDEDEVDEEEPHSNQEVNESQQEEKADSENFEDGENQDEKLQDEEQKQSEDEKEKSSSETSDGEKEGEGEKEMKEFEFPDTVVDIQHVSGDRFKIQSSSKEPEEGAEQVVYLGDDKPLIVSTSQKGKKAHLPSKTGTGLAGGNKQEQKNPEQPAVKGRQLPEWKQQMKDEQGQGKGKQSQKRKLKKIKEKYKDQDEEDRRLMTEMLHSSKKESKGKRRKAKNKEKGQQGDDKLSGKKGNKPPPQPKNAQAPAPGDLDEEDLALDEEEKAREDEDQILLNMLTGIPHSEDELLFAVSVCAPYNTLLNYKYKVKLLPGTGKRGKGAKTALNMFINDKTATQREKDLLKSVKDQDLARNIPGRVKLAAPQLQKHKKMVLTDSDKCIIQALRKEKGYSLNKILQEYPSRQ
ncbi:unnamed protein product [Darwinula stevensoni]|uniref:Nuclear export mediator factor NEMF n=1 Tax=Darwinula stevensoni TaxID=69355 RepID=A0A7R8X235_9CRUS|nr:unnamed protein product [Darwinula stevensoni]CAG0883508.1 unnamed protein product [Darwinula stevensoni]